MGFRINSRIIFINTMYNIKTLLIKWKEYKSILAIVSKMQINITLGLNVNSQKLSNTKNQDMNILQMSIDNRDIKTKTLSWNKYLISKFENITKQYNILPVLQIILHTYTISSNKRLKTIYNSSEILCDNKRPIKAITSVTITLSEKYTINTHQMSKGIIPVAKSKPHIEEINN